MALHGHGGFYFSLVSCKNEDGYDFCKGEIGCLSVGFRRQSVCRPKDDLHSARGKQAEFLACKHRY